MYHCYFILGVPVIYQQVDQYAQTTLDGWVRSLYIYECDSFYIVNTVYSKQIRLPTIIRYSETGLY